MWGQIWLTSGDIDKPSPGPKPLPRVKPTENLMTGIGTRTLVPTRSLGSLRTGCAKWLPTNAARAFCPPGALPEDAGARAVFTYSHLLLSHPGGHPEVSSRREETLVGEAAGDSSSSWDSPYSLPALLSPGAARGPHVLRPLKPLVLSPRRPGCVCVSG